MTQGTAIIVHQIMDAPHHWSESGDCITNGYYRVAFDGSYYSMGSGKYATDEGDAESFRKAIAVWKDETGWRPKNEDRSEKKVSEVKRSIPLSERERLAYSEFVRTTRSSLKSFAVHSDSVILSRSIQNALDIIDSVLMPLDRIEGRKPNAKESGVSSA